MECENCVEILADFLLDELQESQAVLVQEHLNICPECMKAYRELKGTGKMLEKVPAMRQLTGTPEFNRAVRAGAAIESAKIISALPPERRVRLEARRAARHDKTASQRLFAARKKMFSTGLIVLAGIAVVTLIIFYPGSGGRHVELGTVKLVVGQVDASSGNQTQPAKDGKPVFLDDVYTTPKDGSARFELNDGSTLYVGPESKVSFRSPTEPSEGFTIRVDSGEIGVQRAALKQDSKDKSHGMRWSVQTELGSTRPEPETHLYLSAVPPKETAGASISVRVLTGNAIVLSRSGATSNLIGGSRYSESSGQGKGRLETDVDARVPKWRAEMLSEVELSSLLNGRVKIRSRQNEGIEVELVYSREASKKVQDDWVAEPAGSNFSSRADGAYVLPNGVNLKHAATFLPPLSMELSLNRDSKPEHLLNFGVSYHIEGGATVIVSNDAMLQIKRRGATLHYAAVPVRKLPDTSEHLTLEISRDKGALATVLSSKEDKTKALELPSDVNHIAGEPWIQGLSEGVAIDEIKITGTISTTWLMERLTKK
jgi:hypothetical protein